MNREEFITQVIENDTLSTSVKINIDLQRSRLKTKQIGFLFYLVREKFCEAKDKTLYRDWVRDNFKIIKSNGIVMNISYNKAVADFISQRSVLLDIKNEYKKILRLIDENYYR